MSSWKIFAQTLFGFCLTSLILCAQSGLLDEEYGLLGYRLETKIEKISGLRCLGTFQFKRKCLKTDTLYFDEIPVKKAIFYFYQNRLHSMEFFFEGRENAQTVLLYLKLKYGEGIQKGYAPHYEWYGQRTILVYDENLLTGNAVVRVESIPLQRQLERDYIQLYGR